jgi:Domain of unknown function (DUF6379)
MTLEASVLREDAVRATSGGYQVDVHLAWYRSLPLSCVEDVAVTVAGRVAARDDVRVRFEGRELALDDLAEMVDDWWFVQDPLTVLIPDPAPQRPGTETEVAVNLATRIPYIIIGPQTALVQRTQVARKVVVR